MRGDIVYHIYGVHEGRAEDYNWGTYRSFLEAEAAIVDLRNVHGSEWEKQHHNRGFVIRTSKVETDFEIPSLPMPRDKYVVIESDLKSEPGTAYSTLVKVYKRGTDDASKLDLINEYSCERGLFDNFEPFRQYGREYALISPSDFTIAVLDLTTGETVAEDEGNGPSGAIRPLGFYVPDWWDVNPKHVIPGSPYWDSDMEWPIGTFGFAWGDYMDGRTHLHYLDLSKITEGIITRDVRFGSVELATANFRHRCLNPLANPTSAPSPYPPFIEVRSHKGNMRVCFSEEREYDLTTGISKACTRSSG